MDSGLRPGYEHRVLQGAQQWRPVRQLRMMQVQMDQDGRAMMVTASPPGTLTPPPAPDSGPLAAGSH